MLTRSGINVCQPFVLKKPFVREATWGRVMRRWNSIELLNNGSAVRLLATSITTRDVLPKVINLYEGIKNGDRHSLAKAITLVESTRRDHKFQSEQLLSTILNKAAVSTRSRSHRSTFRIGLSGPPGVGKSTFLETFGMYILSQGHRVAVLAVDPSSSRSGGSILGDKTRMPQLSNQENAYVRPSPSRGTLGTYLAMNNLSSLLDNIIDLLSPCMVARNTNEAIILCEAAGYDVCLVETVGVGQSETMVAEMVDMFVLMVPPAGGDEIQGLKKGIVEISDLVIINKSDGAFQGAAIQAMTEYTSALKYLQPNTPVWKPRVIRVSAKSNVGIKETWDIIQEYCNVMRESGQFEKRRGEQRKLWMWTQIKNELMDRLKSDTAIRTMVEELEEKVFQGEMASGAAADYVVDRFTNKYRQ
ncbi:9172_t:CDS:10 [Paraglomus occultum]|uniref:9172_t:CDS:1 n=1 Tax=Paraglomus occultum TaxID=144539 RepID=A0A9N8W8A2_9GLOM|nr:9172_t:CDS:10 [Paraglomus occultum]